MDEWIPLYKVASKNLDLDAPILREIFGQLQAAAHCTPSPAYRLDAEAQYAMGWWFFVIHVREGFVRGVLEHMRARDPGARDERAVLEEMRRRLKSRGSTATINHNGDRSIFAKYWSWLMR